MRVWLILIGCACLAQIAAGILLVHTQRRQVFQQERVSYDDTGESSQGLVARQSDSLHAAGQVRLGEEAASWEIPLLLLLCGVPLIVFASVLYRYALFSKGLEELSASIRGVSVRKKSSFQDPDMAEVLFSTAECLDSLAKQLAGLTERMHTSEERHRELLANLSHDLRTPLASLQGYIETLLSRHSEIDATERERLLRIVDKSVGTLMRMIEDLFASLRLEAGVGLPRMSEVHLIQIAEELSLQFYSMAKQKGVELEIAVPPASYTVRGDMNLLRRALTNVIQNAVCYTPSGGKVGVNFLESSDFFEVVVEDSGEGIPEEDRERVFERFYRVHKDRSLETGGSGLGLSIAKDIVAAHGGEISLESAVGVGTTVRVRIPKHRRA